MNKQYTKKQIIEAIAYWKKQLNIENHKKLNEDINKNTLFKIIESNLFEMVKLTRKLKNSIDDDIDVEVDNYLALIDAIVEKNDGKALITLAQQLDDTCNGHQYTQHFPHVIMSTLIKILKKN